MSETSIWGYSLSEFANMTASSSPTPGGGSVAMVSAVLGLSLVSMALEISKAKATDQNQYDTLLNEIGLISQSMRESADQDILVFSRYMDALQLPRQTDTEKTERKSKLDEAAIKSTEVPLAGAKLCLKGLELASASCSLSTKHLLSDVKAGAYLLFSGLQAVLLNVDANLSSLSVENREFFSASRKEIEMRGREIALTVAAHS